MERDSDIPPSERKEDAIIQQQGGRLRAFKSANETHWQAPAVMISSVLLGAAFAIGHDRFYNHFNGREVNSGLQQKVIINVGTAFAILVKMWFTVAAATVFSQQLFMSLERRAEQINDIDSLFGVLGYAWEFGKIKLWCRHFALALIAVVVWTLPVAAVFTPGTIEVHSDVRYDNSTLLRPAQPQQSWRGKQKFANTQIDYSVLTREGQYTESSLVLNSPSGILHAVAVGSAGRRDILPIPAPYQNSSYKLSFYGPGLACDSASAQDLATFNEALASARKARILPSLNTILGGVQDAQDPSSYVLKYNAWMKSQNSGFNLSHPSWNNDTRNSHPFPYADNTGYFYFNISAHDVLVACHLHNASYDVEFRFQNSEQSINVTSVKLHGLVPFDETVIVGVGDTDISDKIDYENAVYSAVQYAFNNIVIGAASNETIAGSTNQGIQYYAGIVSLSMLRDFIESEDPVKVDIIIDALQSIFQNITLSTLSTPELRLTDDEAEPITGSTWLSINVYVYQPENLYVAYGCSLLAAILCVLWGFHVMAHHGRLTYSIKFSTLLRTTRQKELDGIVSSAARRGNDPLPHEIKIHKLRYRLGGDHDLDGFQLVSSSDSDTSEYAKAEVGEQLDFRNEFTSEISRVSEDLNRESTKPRIRRKPVPGVRITSISGSGTDGSG